MEGPRGPPDWWLRERLNLVGEIMRPVLLIRQGNVSQEEPKRKFLLNMQLNLLGVVSHEVSWQEPPSRPLSSAPRRRRRRRRRRRSSRRGEGHVVLRLLLLLLQLKRGRDCGRREDGGAVVLL